MKFQHRRDYYAGALLVFLGGGAALQGSRYEMGHLTNMGPGFFPTILGIMLAFIGVIIAGTAVYSAESATIDAAALRPDWRGWICITLAALLFIVLANRAGLVPGTFACVFIAAMGDRTNTWKQAALLAAGVTFFGTLLFSYVLHIQIPIFGSM
jgi:hypothetical protein